MSPGWYGGYNWTLVLWTYLTKLSFQLERVIVKGLMGLTGDLKGDYFPLHGSRSYADKPTGMSVEKEEELRNNGNLFQVSACFSNRT